MEPQTFPNFKTLPKELRDTIWEFAVQEETKLPSKVVEYDRVYLTPRDESVYFYVISVQRSPYSEHVTLWNVCQESRDAVMRLGKVFEASYASFRKKAEQSTLRRGMNCIWIPSESHQAKRKNLYLKTSYFNPSLSYEETSHIFGALFDRLVSHLELQDTATRHEFIPTFYRTEADIPLPYELSHAVEIDGFERACDAHTWPDWLRVMTEYLREAGRRKCSRPPLDQLLKAFEAQDMAWTGWAGEDI